DQIPILRGEGDTSALDEAIATVRSGALAAIAPEGRVNDAPLRGLQRMRTGLARIAIPTGAPVIPVGIWGTYERWPRGRINPQRFWRRPELALAFGPPLVPSGDPDSQDAIDRVTAEVADALGTQVERARAICRR